MEWVTEPSGPPVAVAARPAARPAQLRRPGRRWRAARRPARRVGAASRRGRRWPRRWSRTVSARRSPRVSAGGRP